MSKIEVNLCGASVLIEVRVVRIRGSRIFLFCCRSCTTDKPKVLSCPVWLQCPGSHVVGVWVESCLPLTTFPVLLISCASGDFYYLQKWEDRGGPSLDYPIRWSFANGRRSMTILGCGTGILWKAWVTVLCVSQMLVLCGDATPSSERVAEFPMDVVLFVLLGLCPDLGRASQQLYARIVWLVELMEWLPLTSLIMRGALVMFTRWLSDKQDPS
jgi:hypothetical protein